MQKCAKGHIIPMRPVVGDIKNWPTNVCWTCVFSK